MTAPGREVVVHPDATALARAAGAELAAAVGAAQAARGVAAVALTGGRNGTALLAALADPAVAAGIDWGRLDVWWSDERWLPAGDPERNHTQARAALLDRVPLDPARVHPMPAADAGTGLGPAADAYAAELAAAGGPVPAFDVALLGVGPDTHVASLFPGHPAVGEAERTVRAVPDAPKPPPARITLTLPAIGAAREVWLLAGGPDKARAVATALAPGAAPPAVPAAGARGRERTRWLLDRSAAAELPPGAAAAAPA